MSTGVEDILVVVTPKDDGTEEDMFKELIADEVSGMEVELDKIPSLDEIVVMVIDVNVEISKNIDELSAMVVELSEKVEERVVFIQLIELVTGASVTIDVDEDDVSGNDLLASNECEISGAPERHQE